MPTPTTNLPPLSSLPLPAATLIIDMRGKKDDDILERLKIEIADLTRDLEIQEIHHWRYLADFLAFLPTEHCPIEPMNPEEVATLRSQSQPTETIKQNIDSIIDEISNILNSHRNAEADSNRITDGRDRQDTKVRVIFLTDAELSNSLATTAAYAAYLKEYSRKHRRDGQSSMIRITVLCLNNSGRVTPSPALEELLWNDRWDHLDDLILIDSSQNGVRIASSVQTYLAELLLYVLLLVPTLQMNSSAPNPQASSPQNTKDRRINLPPKTYSVGLASMEYSARWRRRFLNYTAVERIIQVIQEGIEKGAEEVAKTWIEDQRENVKNAVPDQLPGNVPALKEAISRANKVVQRPGRVLTAHTFGLITGPRAVDNLREYLTKITRTYIRETGETGTRTPTLKDAIDAIPLILQRLYEWENEDPDAKAGIPLFKVQTTARQVLSYQDFFVGARGALSRGKLDLKELSKAISDLESEHLNKKPLNLLLKREQLEQDVNPKINTLQHHIERFPYWSSVLRLKHPMAWLTLLFTSCLATVVTFIGIAWLRDLITYLSANGFPLPVSTIGTIMDSLFLVSPVDRAALNLSKQTILS